jgi:ribonucleoside-diphosphate reductase alpha chain
MRQIDASQTSAIQTTPTASTEDSPMAAAIDNTAASAQTQTLQRPGSERPIATAAEVAARGSNHEITAHQPGQVQVIRRNGKVTHFDPSKIKVAMTKAFIAVEGSGAAASSRIHHLVDELTEQVSSALTRRLPGGGTVHIEDIQDQVELALMRAGEHKVARDYVIYRDARARERAEKASSATTASSSEMTASRSPSPMAAPGHSMSSACADSRARPPLALRPLMTGRSSTIRCATSSTASRRPMSARRW